MSDYVVEVRGQSVLVNDTGAIYTVVVQDQEVGPIVVQKQELQVSVTEPNVDVIVNSNDIEVSIQSPTADIDLTQYGPAAITGVLPTLNGGTGLTALPDVSKSITIKSPTVVVNPIVIWYTYKDTQIDKIVATQLAGTSVQWSLLYGPTIDTITNSIKSHVVTSGLTTITVFDTLSVGINNFVGLAIENVIGPTSDFSLTIIHKW
jgi:hypothetical protein